MIAQAIWTAALLTPILAVGCSAQTEQIAAHPNAPAMDWRKDPSELAIERWSSVRGAVSERCAEYARSIRFEWIDDAAEITARCGLGYPVIGCFTVDADGPVALVRGDALTNTLVHEAMHSLEACETRTIDNSHHDSRLWSGLMTGEQR